MYEWVDEVNSIINTLVGELNDKLLQQEIYKEVYKILKNHEVSGIIDCFSIVNTPQIIDDYDFHLSVCTPNIDYLFRFKVSKDFIWQ